MPIITISRGSLSGGALLADKLGARLGCKVISRDVIIEAAKKYGVSEEKMQAGMQSPPGFWERLTGHREQYILAVQATLARLVQDGDTIYHGMAGHLLLKGLTPVVKLRLIAPVDYRIRAAMVAHGFTHEQALSHIENVDRERARWVRQMYGVEWSDPTLYDLVINLANITIDSAVDLVADLVKRQEFRHSPESDQALRDFSLTTQVRAELAFHSGFPAGSVDVVARSGVIHLSGGQYFEDNRRAVVRFVKQIDGVVAVVPDLEDDSLPAPGDADTAEKHAADIMLPFSGYPHVPEWATIREVMAAVSASTVKLHDGHLIHPRYVLVVDKGDRLVGVVTRRDLLRGLTPQLKSLEKAREKIEAVMPFAAASYPVTFRWISFFGSPAVANSWEPVRSVVQPIRATVQKDDDLSTVVTTMIQHGVDLLPVLEGETTVGVILMTDVFDTVAQFIVEHGTKRPGAAGT